MPFTPQRTLFKMSGTGNIFLIVNLLSNGEKEQGRQLLSAQASRSQMAQFLCQNKNGFNADGLLFIEESHGAEDFRWDFYNADGSSAEMCGNAARCAAHWYFSWKNKSLLNLKNSNLTNNNDENKPISFKTSHTTIHAWILKNQQVRVQMPPVVSIHTNSTLTLDNYKLTFDEINTGVPHLVLNLPDQNLQEPDGIWQERAKKLRHHSRFSPQGTNVTFYKVLPKSNSLEAITFERGVEGFTQACGTGAVAAAWSFMNSKNNFCSATVQMPGGILTIDLSKKDPFLEGPVDYLAQIQLLNYFKF